MPQLRLITFNLAHARGLRPIQGLATRKTLRRNLERVAEMLRAWQPDVVAFQEIDQDSSWAGRFDHLDFLREHTGLPHAVFGLTNRRNGLIRLHYGNALLSAHPIRFSEAAVFGPRTVGEKGFLFAELEVGRRCVPLVNLHLHYRRKAERLRQAAAVLDYLEVARATRGASWSCAPLVCGDFNTSQRHGDATALMLEALSEEGAYSAHPQRARTFPSPFPRRALDHVLLPPSCREVFSLVIKSYLSDHRPVLVDCTLA